MEDEFENAEMEDLVEFENEEIEDGAGMLSNFNPEWFALFNDLFEKIEDRDGIDYDILRNLFMGYALRILIKFDELIEDSELDTLLRLHYISPEDYESQLRLKRDWQHNLPLLANESFRYKNFADTIFHLILENNDDKNVYLNISQEGHYKIDPHDLLKRNELYSAVGNIVNSYTYIREWRFYDQLDVMVPFDALPTNEDYIPSGEELENDILQRQHIRNAKELADQCAIVARDKERDRVERSERIGGRRRRRKTIKKTKKRSTTRRARVHPRRSSNRKIHKVRKARKTRTTRSRRN